MYGVSKENDWAFNRDAYVSVHVCVISAVGMLLTVASSLMLSQCLGFLLCVMDFCGRFCEGFLCLYGMLFVHMYVLCG